MSFDLIWQNPGRFRSSTHMMVALAICRYTRAGDGVCYAYKRTLAEKTKLHPKTIQRAIAELAEDGILRLQPSTGVDGRSGANRIILTLRGVVDSEGESEAVEPHAAPGSDGGPFRSRGLPSNAVEGSAWGAHDSASKENGDSIGIDNGESVPRADALTDSTVAFNAWNELAERLGLAKAETLTETRAKKLRKRLEEAGIDGWRRALENVAASRFLTGQVKGDDRKWRCTFDFLLQASGFQKVLEGQYDRDLAGKGPASDRSDSLMLAELKRNREVQVGVMTDHRNDGTWPAWAGPKPGEPGCPISPAVLQRFGYGPAVAPGAMRAGPADPSPPDEDSATLAALLED